MPVAQLWEETPSGAVERVRLMAKPDFTAATEQEARAHGLELVRSWLAGGPGHERCRDGSLILPCEAVRRAAAPDAALLEYVQSAHEAAADLGRWDRAALERPREPGTPA
jgi:hypothetical protein